ncbi:glycosyltransferase family 4 protein [Cellulomonas triticagri]|uniref:D-inositol 3-phosphate glycosyltransferase n=1 Tax=Cellulomonas triticagri TaxID=2483352 RepID=A0A3M2JFN5_9CELL|nr:glycosyltransferase family 4 protein [Cellulomonas triticagri]RMI12582.1 glycosyltransferase WbuB [Cellulomonas triticagri]
MHIVLVTHHYLPEVGAPQRRWAALSARFVAAGHRVTVLTPPPHYPEGRAGDLTEDLRVHAVATGPGGERIHRVRFREHGSDLRSRTRDQAVAAAHSVIVGWRRLRGPDQPDVVVATAPGIPSLGAGHVLARALGVPLVVEMRDAWPDLIAPSGMWGDARRRGWKRLATRLAHRGVTAMQRQADAVVTTTASFADVLLARRVTSVDVVRNGAPLHEPLRSAPVPGPRFRILYLGTMGRSQGLTTALRAAADLDRRGVPATLRLVGSGHEEPLLRAEARALGAPAEFLGRVARAQVSEHYDWADTVLVSLRAWDPFEWTVPSKLYEAMAAGRHVSASLAGEAAYVVREAGAGDVVRPESPEGLADLWAALAADRRRLDVGDRGRRWVAEHANFDRLAAHYLEVIEGVVG